MGTFPNSPSVDDTTTIGSKTFKWTGYAWIQEVSGSSGSSGGASATGATYVYTSGSSLANASSNGEFFHSTSSNTISINQNDNNGDSFADALNSTLTTTGRIGVIFGDSTIERNFYYDSVTLFSGSYTFTATGILPNISTGSGKTVTINVYADAPAQAASEYFRFPDGTEAESIVTSFNGLTGDVTAGNGLFDTTFATGTSLDHSINFDNINTVSGGGRKFPVLLEDGAVTFDYIRAQDIFLDSEFVFGINSFSISGSSTALIGTGNYSLTGRSLSASYQTPGSISVADADVTTNASSDSGFPVDLSSGSASVASNNIAFPASKNSSVTFTLGATGSDGSFATSTDSITFRNNNYYGVSTNAGLTGPDLSSLSSNLDDNRSYSFSVNAGAGEYIYYAYPSSYGDASFTVGGFAGGFSKLHGGATAHTNSAGFSETYFIYRSDNASLGSTEVVVS